jgi:CO/xanthine dehydrogenase Mo-binding subunit/CO/xanthine dehydrogenase FAD-binding subunit
MSLSVLGRSVRPLDWERITSGRFGYIGDIVLEGLLVGRILRSPHAHARLVSVDTSRARGMPGVHAIVTASDFPDDARYVHDGARDRAPFAVDVVRFVGQEVAAVAAETVEQAEAALARIDVVYQPLPASFTIDQALEDGAPALHERPTGLRNIALVMARQWGDMAKARAASPASVSGRYWFPPQTHVCMETNATTAQWRDGKLHLWTGTQAPYFVAREMAGLLQLEQSDVILHEVGIGGAFGSKSRIGEHEAITAVLAREARRPVRIALTRAEEFAMTKTRHGWRVDLALHADPTGLVRGIESKIAVDNGAYVHSGWSVMSSGPKALGTLYRAEAVSVDARLIDTCKQPGGQFRGYGTTQAVYALESLVDDLAEKLGVDPIELRLRNANLPDTQTLQGARIQTARLAECLDAVRRALDWDTKKKQRRPGRGLGVACGFHSSGTYAFPGSNRNDSVIDLDTDGNALIRFGGADTGTGQRTILTQIVAHNLGLPLERVRIVSIESDQTPYDLGAWGTRGTYYSGHAAIKACEAIVERLTSVATRVLGNQPIRFEDGDAVAETGRVPIGKLVAMHADTADGVLSTEVSYVDETSQLLDDDGRGNFSATYSFAAHAAEVEVDLKTGKLRIVDYAAAHDIGTALNPVMVHGQIAGGVQMGGGAAFGEEMIHEQGRAVNPALINYAMMRAADLPRIRTMLVEGGDPKGPHGAKGVGELCNTPPSPAIANAVYDATGVRIAELPITPDKIVTALEKKAGRRRDHRLWRRPSRWWIALVRWLYPLGLLKLLHDRQLRHPASTRSPPIKRIDTPTTVEAAVDALKGGGAPLAGGTDLLPSRQQGLVRAGHFASLIEIAEMQGVRQEADGSVAIGAATTLAALAKALPMLLPTIATIASAQIRAMATVGGNLLQGKRCWFYRNGFNCYKRAGLSAPCYAIAGDHRFHHAVIGGHRCQAVTPSDLAAALIALDAEVTIAGRFGRRRLAMAALYTGPGETQLGPEEVLVDVRIAAPALRRRLCFEKLALWEGDFAIASCALSYRDDGDGSWRELRIVLGGLAPVPWRATAAERALDGKRPTASALGQLVSEQLDRTAHPLKRNGWKLAAAAGLAENAAQRLLERTP